jgi:hypothetical protein
MARETVNNILNSRLCLITGSAQWGWEVVARKGAHCQTWLSLFMGSLSLSHPPYRETARELSQTSPDGRWPQEEGTETLVTIRQQKEAQKWLLSV